MCQLDKIFYGWYKCLVLVRFQVNLKMDKYRDCIEGLHTLMYIKERRCSYILYRLEESPGAHDCVHYTHSCAVLILLIETRFQFFLVQGSYHRAYVRATARYGIFWLNARPEDEDLLKRDTRDISMALKGFVAYRPMERWMAGWRGRCSLRDLSAARCDFCK